MYTKRVQIVNYGPIDRIDIAFPFEGETPKPVLLVGENGSGKSILLSHLVNGLVSAKDDAYPGTPEVETGKVYKIRSGLYIKSEREYYFGRVDFEEGLFLAEMRSNRRKRDYGDMPPGPLEPDAQDAWNKMNPNESDYIESSFTPGNREGIEGIFAKSCVLYFPHNRFEEPAWLNEENLNSQAQHMDLKHVQGQTGRKLISYSPLRDNQNWLFDLIYDRAAFEIQTHQVNLPVNEGNVTVPIPLFSGYSGDATRMYETVLRIVRTILKRQDARFGIGRRHNRAVSLVSDLTGPIVPNIFQLSSGETSLLNMFLSILRDFDLCSTAFSQAVDVRGIAVIDEVDLHLHAVHQFEILPKLIKMLPNVQFVVTTHSPLFVLGMQRAFGDDGFALHRLPEGNRISPEEFSEFGHAYQAFSTTLTFNEDVRAAIEASSEPVVFVEGTTDKRYIERASALFGKEAVLDSIDIRDGGGSGSVAKIWKDSVLPLTESLPHKVLLLFDCDTIRQAACKGKLFQRSIPLRCNTPVNKGIENLFGRPTLELARQHKPAFFITEEEHCGTDEHGRPITIPERWEVNDSEKTNLCDWLCVNGSREDFEGFQVVFDLIEEAFDLSPSTSTGSEGETAP